MDIVRERPSRPVWLRKAALLLVGIIVVVGVVLSLRRTSVAAPLVEKSAVWTERVRRGNLLRQIPVTGTLVPEHVQWLSAQTAARVARIAVRPGAEVEADTVIVVLENTDVELAALDAERQAASAESKLIELDVKSKIDETQQAAAMAALRVDHRDAERHAGAANRLASEGLVPENERRDAVERVTGLSERTAVEEGRRAALMSGRSRQVAAQRAEIERLREIAAFRRRQLAALEVRATIRGVVQDIPLQNGQWVAIGTVLAKVAEPGRLKAELKVSQSLVGDVHRGLAVRFESGANGVRGTVERVDPTVVAGSVKIEATLGDKLPPGLRADQTVSGFLEVETLENVLYVPRPAGARDETTVGVFRLDPDHVHATRTSVQIGRGSAREVEISAGLVEGDEIVVSDVSAWESARVRLK